MGRLALPSGSRVYLDAAPIIYSVERNPDYALVMTEIWRTVELGDLSVYTSELTLLETLIHPVRDDDTDLATAYETLLTAFEVQLIEITADVLRIAVQFRINQKT